MTASMPSQHLPDAVPEPQRWGDIGVKGAPLIMIALGLAVGFRHVWNIGAEGHTSWARSPAPASRS
jgi:ABC-type uncharacterized transport system permease subunit